MTIKLVDFKDPTTLTQWVKRLSYFGVFASILALFAGYEEYEYFQKLSQGLYLTEDLASSAESLKEKWVATAGIFQFSILLQYILLFMWIYRINLNTRALGSENMKFTPGWSVGWFFIPIVNLWKPYGVLKELWTSNQSSQVIESDGKVRAKFIGWFWLFMLVSTTFGNKAAFKSYVATELPQLIAVNKLTLISDFLDIPYFILTMVLIKRIYEAHMVKFAARADEYHQQMGALSVVDKQGKNKSKWIKRSLLSLLFILIAIMLICLLLIWFDPFPDLID